jgi:trigger factor
MNIKRENIGLLNDLIIIELSVEDYQEQVGKSLKDLRRKANVPGFRQGNVPMGMIEKLYKKSVVAEEVSKLTNDEFYKYLKENKLSILFEPIACEDKTQGDFDKASNFSFTFEIGLRPEMTLNYADAKQVTLYRVIAAEHEIDKELMDLRRRAGKFSSTEEVAQDDMLLVTVTPENEGEEFTSSLVLNYIKDDNLQSFIGRKLHEEMVIDTTEVFKSDYERSTFLKIKVDELEKAPKTVRIKIDAIHHRELAEMNEEFFSKLFPDESVKDETTLRVMIKLQIELRHVSETSMIFRNKALEVLIEKTVLELPEAFIKRYIVENQQQYTAEDFEEKYPEIKKSIVYQLIENQICTDCNIDVSRDEILKYMDEYVRMSNFGTMAPMNEDIEKQIAASVQQMMKNQKNIDNTYDNIFHEKITNGLKEKIQPDVKELSFEDFIAEVSGKEEEKPKAAKAKTKKIKELE